MKGERWLFARRKAPGILVAWAPGHLTAGDAREIGKVLARRYEDAIVASRGPAAEQVGWPVAGNPAGRKSGRPGPRRARAARRPAAKRKTRARAARRRRRSNPAPAVLERGARTFRRWHGFDPNNVIAVKGKAMQMPRTLVVLGTVPEIVYSSNKFDGRVKSYSHDTSKPHPLLVTGPDGKGLWIVDRNGQPGGRVRVTARGLVG